MANSGCGIYRNRAWNRPNIEITKDNIGSFQRYARKYGIDYSLKWTRQETRPAILCFLRQGTQMP